MERREFLQSMTLSAADAILLGCCGSLLGCKVPAFSRAGPGKKGKVLICLSPRKPETSTIRLFDWDSHDYADFDVPLTLIHSIVQDRFDKNILYVFEIFGSCVRLDLADQTLVKMDHRGKDEMFNGHGAQNSSGDYLFCTEISKTAGSIVNIRSAKTLEKVGTTPEECGNSHQTATLPGSNLLVTGNLRIKGEPTGAITFFDYKKNSVANRIEFPMPVLHLLPLSSTEVIGLSLLTSWPKDHNKSLSPLANSAQNINHFSSGQEFVTSPLYYANVDGRHETLWDKEHQAFFLDNFGLTGVSKNRFLSGHHGSGKVFLWKDRKIEAVFTVPDAKNLVASADGSEFMVASGEKLLLFSLKDFSRINALGDFPPVVAMSSYQPKKS